MAQDDGRLVMAAILGFGGGLYTFAKGFREFRKYRLVADTPTIPVHSVPMGLVHVQGRACGEATLISPVTHTPCYLFKVDVEEWHSSSEGGGEWKHLATDVQSVKFDLEDASGKVLIDATSAERDLPGSPVRKLGSQSAAASAAVPAQFQGLPTSAGMPATDGELFQYIEQARLRHIGQIVGKGIGLIARAVDPTHQPQRQPWLGVLANPGSSGAETFKNQMIKMMVARKDPTGANTQLALEVWKYPQGSPQFESALVRFAQAYSRIMAPNKPAPNAAAVLANFREHPQILLQVALVAGTSDAQTDPELERARQTAIAFGRHDTTAPDRRTTHPSSGHFRLTESCLVPGQTYNITGTCAENPNPRHEHDRNIILLGTNEPTFLISSKSGKQLESGLRKRAAYRVLGGAALAVVCLAILLGKMGLL